MCHEEPLDVDASPDRALSELRQVGIQFEHKHTRVLAQHILSVCEVLLEVTNLSATCQSILYLGLINFLIK